MSRTPVIAIFDIGKTNKKLFLFDEDYNVVYELSSHLDEIKDEDGDPCEDIDALTQWITGNFSTLLNDTRFDIRALNFSTYGASFVHLGDGGKTVGQLYNYLKPFPEDLKNEFYKNYGGKIEFASTTASPVLGNLNSGMQLYFLKHIKPDLFRSIRVSLHLPQFVSSLFTGSYCSELTSIGCHTNLWDFRARDYHRWVGAEEIDTKLPPIRHSDSPFEINIGSKIMYSGIGLHDSSAAMIPYLKSTSEPFVLLSTGTWSITLNPFNKEPLTAEQLAQDCLSYLTFEGAPVKAARLFSGQIHEDISRELSVYFGVPKEAYKDVSKQEDWRSFRSGLTSDELKEIFMQKRYSRFGSFSHVYTALIEHLIHLQIESTNHVIQPGTKSIYVDGGFSQNEIFMQLLAEAYGDKKIYAASVAQASALGAALILHDVWNKSELRDDLLSLRRIE